MIDYENRAMKQPLLYLTTLLIAFSTRLSADAEGNWIRDLNLNLNLNQGNSENLSTNTGVDLSRKTDKHEISAAAKYSYGESTFRDADGRREERTTQDKSEAAAQYNRFLSEQTYALAGFSALKDRIADIDYRVLLGPGIGRYLVRDDIQTLAIEAGLSHLLEKVSEQRADSPLFRFAQRYTRKLGENAEVWQSLEYLPEVEDFQSYLLNTELGVQARLNGNLGLRMVLKNRYDDTPGRQNKRNDLNLLAGISYRF